MKRLLVPVVQQPAAARSGAASLLSVCLGFGIRATESEIFDQCGGTVSGICIDELEAEANRRGLSCRQSIVPVDHLLHLSSNVPSIIVTHVDGGRLGSVVLWQKLGGLLQVMDPQLGRRWISGNRLAERLYRHLQPVSSKSLSEWIRTEAFESPLEVRMKRLGIPDTKTLIANAACEPGWRGVATLDAVVRQAASQVAGRKRKGRANRTCIVTNWQAALLTPEIVPEEFWFVRRRRRTDAPESDTVWIYGAVVLSVRLASP